MKIAIYQMDSTSGAFEANADKIIAAAIEAQEKGAEMLITPAFSLTGTGLQALLNYKKLDKQIEQQIKKIKQVKGISIIFGVIEREKDRFSHRILGLQNGKTHLILQQEYNEKSEYCIELAGKNKKNPLIYFDNSPFSLTQFQDTQEKLKKFGRNWDISVEDTKEAEFLEKILRKYIWVMAFHNCICDLYNKPEHKIATQCNCDPRFLKMVIEVL